MSGAADTHNQLLQRRRRLQIGVAGFKVRSFGRAERPSDSQRARRCARDSAQEAPTGRCRLQESAAQPTRSPRRGRRGRPSR